MMICNNMLKFRNIGSTLRGREFVLEDNIKWDYYRFVTSLQNDSNNDAPPQSDDDETSSQNNSSDENKTPPSPQDNSSDENTTPPSPQDNSSDENKTSSSSQDNNSDENETLSSPQDGSNDTPTQNIGSDSNQKKDSTTEKAHKKKRFKWIRDKIVRLSSWFKNMIKSLLYDSKFLLKPKDDESE